MNNANKKAIISDIETAVQENGNYKLCIREYSDTFYIKLNKKDNSYDCKVPEIFIEDEMYGTHAFRIIVQTTSYGNASIDDIIIIADELKKAATLAKEITRILIAHGEAPFDELHG